MTDFYKKYYQRTSLGEGNKEISLLFSFKFRSGAKNKKTFHRYFFVVFFADFTVGELKKFSIGLECEKKRQLLRHVLMLSEEYFFFKREHFSKKSTFGHLARGT